MNTVLIYGEPGVGKTEITKGMVQGYEKHTKPFAHYTKHNRCILGDYDADTIFLGTDKLSMSVQPLVVEFMRNNPQYEYIIEGDRLFNGKFIEAINPIIVIITASAAEIKERRLKRGSDQDPTFLKAKTTKIKNITEKYPHYIINNGNDTCITKVRQEIAALLAGRSELAITLPPEPEQGSLF